MSASCGFSVPMFPVSVGLAICQDLVGHAASMWEVFGCPAGYDLLLASPFVYVWAPRLVSVSSHDSLPTNALSSAGVVPRMCYGRSGVAPIVSTRRQMMLLVRWFSQLSCARASSVVCFSPFLQSCFFLHPPGFSFPYIKFPCVVAIGKIMLGPCANQTGNGGRQIHVCVVMRVQVGWDTSIRAHDLIILRRCFCF